MAFIRPARLDELSELSALAVRSKTHWGYDSQFMDACREELAVSPEQWRQGEVFVSTQGDEPLGFYSLEWLDADRAELGHLFVEPRAIGHGHGRALLRHACERTAASGRTQLVIQGDPNAERFYRAAGARPIGERPSDSIPGRVLPLFVLDVTA